MALAEVVSLHDSNFRDPAATLRKIADDIERGEFGAVGSIGIVILGDQLTVCRAGEDADPCSIGMLLHAGFMKMSKGIAEHGEN